MKKLPKKILSIFPETVIEMWLGQLLFFAVCELTGVWFVSDKTGYTIGLLCGTLLALGSIYHIWWALDKSLDMEEKRAGGFVGTQYGIRYGALILLIAFLYVTGFGNAFAAFLGYMGIKATAYMQPFIHRILDKVIFFEEKI